MIVTPVESHIELPQSDTSRSKGVHVSSVIRGIAIETGILKADHADEIPLADVREITDRVAILRICIGLAWEDWYIRNILYHDGVVKHPGEITVDNIHMTPDGESLKDIAFGKYAPCIHEVKATYKSVNTVAELENQWMWLSQMKSYCKGAGTRYARMHTLFVCGDYKMPIRPELKIWDLEFTKQEIDENWSLITQYRDLRAVNDPIRQRSR